MCAPRPWAEAPGPFVKGPIVARPSDRFSPRSPAGGAPFDAERPVFAAVIRPHRSLGPQGARIVITCLCVSAVVSSIPFIVLGAWPVAGFFGLDIVALAIALRVNLKRGGAYEEVALSPVELLLRRVSHHGRATEWRLNPAWTRVERESDEDYGLQRLTLVSGGTRVDIGGALSPPERESFAHALGEGLARARRGG